MAGFTDTKGTSEVAGALVWRHTHTTLTIGSAFGGTHTHYHFTVFLNPWCPGNVRAVRSQPRGALRSRGREGAAHGGGRTLLQRTRALHVSNRTDDAAARSRAPPSSRIPPARAAAVAVLLGWPKSQAHLRAFPAVRSGAAEVTPRPRTPS